MGDLSRSFSRKEFKCKCGACDFDTVDVVLLRTLQNLHYGLSRMFDANVQIIITSGCRCQNHNKDIGGKQNSQHLYGKAADIVCSFKTERGWVPIETDIVYKYLNDSYTNIYGIGKYEKFVHIDVRDKKARW